MRIKYICKNIIYTIGFMFRPITTVLFSFLFLLLTVGALVAVIINLNKGSQLYDILLAILTGITASLLIAMMTELYHNFRFNQKRQRELREYFGFIAFYEISVMSIVKTDLEYETEAALSEGRGYAVFLQLGKIIPVLREALNNRDYLYRKEMKEIDEIISLYDYLVKFIATNLFNHFLGLINQKGYNLVIEEEKQAVVDDEWITNYPNLYDFLDKEASYYVQNKQSSDVSGKDFEELISIVEKAIFYNDFIFHNYFEITDVRSVPIEKVTENAIETGFELRSNRMSRDCIQIDQSMVKLQKRLTREPFILEIASYREKDW